MALAAPSVPGLYPDRQECHMVIKAILLDLDDTLRFSGNGLNLDFSVLGSEKLSGIEKIQMAGTGRLPTAFLCSPRAGGG